MWRRSTASLVHPAVRVWSLKRCATPVAVPPPLAVALRAASCCIPPWPSITSHRVLEVGLAAPSGRSMESKSVSDMQWRAHTINDGFMRPRMRWCRSLQQLPARAVETREENQRQQRWRAEKQCLQTQSLQHLHRPLPLQQLLHRASPGRNAARRNLQRESAGAAISACFDDLVHCRLCFPRARVELSTSHT